MREAEVGVIHLRERSHGQGRQADPGGWKGRGEVLLLSPQRESTLLTKGL